jgi:hypothetical protein
MNILVLQAIKILASLLLGSGVFDRVIAVVKDWSDKQIDGAKKREGVLNQLEVIGLGLSASLTNLAVELAVQYLKKVSK